MLIGIFYSQVVESSSLVSVLFLKAISHPYISFFHLLVNGFSVTSFRTFSKTPTFIILVGGIGGWGGIKMASAKNNQLISSQVHAVQLKPTVKVQISGRMASIGISDVVSASVYSEKTRMKKLMVMMILLLVL